MSDPQLQFPIKQTVVSGHTFSISSRYDFTGCRILGRGSYGVVSQAIDTLTKERLAIKRIRPYASDEWDARHTLREIRLMKLLSSHPNIITLYELSLFQEKMELYMVMELMDCDLHHIIQSKQPLTEMHFKCFAKQLLEGVKAMHSVGVFHRDLKPGNLLVSKDCQLRITDFGLARFMDDDTLRGHNEQIPQTEYVVTRWYRCPELLLAPNRPYNQAIDIWSVGCIIAELIRRKPLFPGKSHANQVQLIFDVLGFSNPNELGFHISTEAASFLNKRCRSPGQDLWDVIPEASEEAVCFIAALLDVNPRHRPTAAQALALPYLSDAEIVCDYSSVRLDPPRPGMFDFENQKMTAEELKEQIHSEVFCATPRLTPTALSQDRTDPEEFSEEDRRSSGAMSPGPNNSRVVTASRTNGPDEESTSSKSINHEGINKERLESKQTGTSNSVSDSTLNAKYNGTNSIFGRVGGTDRRQGTEDHVIENDRIEPFSTKSLSGPSSNVSEEPTAVRVRDGDVDRQRARDTSALFPSFSDKNAKRRDRVNGTDKSSESDNVIEEEVEGEEERRNPFARNSDKLSTLPEPKKQPGQGEPRAERFSVSRSRLDSKSQSTGGVEDTGRDRVSTTGGSGRFFLQAIRNTLSLGGSGSGGITGSSGLGSSAQVEPSETDSTPETTGFSTAREVPVGPEAPGGREASPRGSALMERPLRLGRMLAGLSLRARPSGRAPDREVEKSNDNEKNIDKNNDSDNNNKNNNKDVYSWLSTDRDMRPKSQKTNNNRASDMNMETTSSKRRVAPELPRLALSQSSNTDKRRADATSGRTSSEISLPEPCSSDRYLRPLTDRPVEIRRSNSRKAALPPSFSNRPPSPNATDHINISDKRNISLGSSSGKSKAGQTEDHNSINRSTDKNLLAVADKSNISSSINRTVNN